MGKGDTLGARVVALLDDGRLDVRCAAALVLGHAGKGDPEVVKALGARIDGADSATLRFLLGGLEALGARGLSRDLAPLLGHDDEEIRTRAARLLEAQGAPAAGAVRRQLEEGNPTARRAAAALLVKLGSEDAQDAMIAQLGDPDAGEAILQKIRAGIDEDKDEKSRKAWGQRAAAAARKSRKNELQLANLLRLLGYVADPARLDTLVEHTGADHPNTVRLAAIAAMRRIVANPGAGKIDDAITTLIALAGDRDANIARAAVDTLRGARIPEGLGKKFAALARSGNAEARKLAMERMPAVGSSAIATLIGNLDGVDPGAREAAMRALQAAPDAAGPLAQALVDADTPERARRIAQALRGHEGRIPPAALATLGKAVATRLDKGDPSGGVVLDVHARLAPDAHATLLFEHAGKLAKAGKHGEAFAALRPLAHMSVRMTDEQRVFLGVLGLKTSGKDLLRAARSVDPVLGQFAQLVAAGHPVAKSLLKRKDLDTEDFFTLGFNFIESHDEDEKEFGRELLEAVIERGPRSKLATAAKNKLRLAGED